MTSLNGWIACRRPARLQKHPTILFAPLVDRWSRRRGRSARDRCGLDKTLVQVDHVVRVDIAQKATHFVVLDNIPYGEGHRDEKHSGRSKEHALHCDLWGKGRGVLEPLVVEHHILACLADKCCANENSCLVESEIGYCARNKGITLFRAVIIGVSSLLIVLSRVASYVQRSQGEMLVFAWSQCK